MTPRRFIAPSAAVWLILGAAYFLIPLVATLIFSLRSNLTGTCCTLGNYGEILHDPQFWKTIKTSFILSLETIVIALLLLVPTVYWVHLKLPRLRPVLSFMALIPFVVPAIRMQDQWPVRSGLAGPLPALKMTLFQILTLPFDGSTVARTMPSHWVS